MGFFDFLSGTDEAEAAAAQNRDVLNRYQGSSLGDLGAYSQEARGDITSGTRRAADALNAGVGQAAGAYQQGIGAYAPLSKLGEEYGGAVNAYYDALGLSGDAGKQRARERFQTAPGYQFEQDEAARLIANQGSRFGAVGGNTLTALSDRSQQIANRGYQQDLDRLASFVNPQLQATQGAAAGIAGGYGNLGQLYANQGGGLAKLYGDEGRDLANISGNVVQGRLGVGRDVATGNMAANNLIAQSGMNQANNYWGAINAGIGAIGNIGGNFLGGKKA